MRKWYKKSSDDIIRQCKHRWGKDTKFAKDYQTFLDSFYKELIRQNGGKSSEKLAAFAENYVANRFQGLIIEQLAREKVPKNSATYIARKAFDDSLLGLLPKSVPKKVSMILSSLKKQMTCIIPISGNRVQPWEVPWSLMLR